MTKKNFAAICAKIIVSISFFLLWTCTNPVEERIDDDVAKKYPEITLKQGLNTIGANFNFGSEVPNETKSLVFTLENTGKSDLIVNGISLSEGSNFMLIHSLNIPLTLGSTLPSNFVEFTIDFTPAGTDTYNDTLTILSSDPDKGNYEVTITGTGVTGDYPVPGNSGNIDIDSVSENSITISFSQAADTETPLNELEYKVIYSVDDIISTPEQEWNGEIVRDWSTSYAPATQGGLQDNKDYWFNVLVKDGSDLVSAYTMKKQTTLRSKRIYWVEAGTNKYIKRALLDGSNVETIVSSGLGDPRDLAVDSTGTYLYFTDDGDNKIKRVNLAGPFTPVELTTPVLSNPIGIALDEANDKLYFSDYGNEKIYSYILGSGDYQEVISAAGGCAGICIDTNSNIIYWADYNSNQIMKANLSSPTPQPVTGGIDSPYAIDIDISSQILYFTESFTPGGNVKRVSTAGGTVEQLSTNYTNPKGIVFSDSNDSVYWTESKASGNVYKSSITVFSPSAIIMSLSNPEGITIY